MFRFYQFIKRPLQKFVGLQRYLYFAAVVKYVFLRYDKREVDIFHFLNMVPRNGLILDIGSNLGVIATLLSKERPMCKIHGFEPIPVNAATTKRISKFFKLKNLTLHEVALGNETGSVEMIMPAMNSVYYEGLSHVEVDNQELDGLRFTVPLKKLDDFSMELQGEIVAIKIDVEGYEYEVLRGAEEILRNNKPIIYCELINEEKGKKVILFLKQFGYQCYVMESGALVHRETYSEGHLNFFFLR